MRTLVVSGAALRQLVAPHGWGYPAGRVDTPGSPVLPWSQEPGVCAICVGLNRHGAWHGQFADSCFLFVVT